MNLRNLESLTNEGARKYLAEFLCFGEQHVIEILTNYFHFTLDLDFSIESLSPTFKALTPVLKTKSREPDLRVPKFIRDTEIYKKGLFDFDEPSKSIVLAASYYLGEAFVRKFAPLSWGCGNVEFAQGNMPVVVGFKFGMEMPPILIAENIFSGVISGLSNEASIDTVIETWSSKYL